jgi:hypothetical protein
VRVRSARDQALADTLDATAGGQKVVNLLDKQLTLETAWPGLSCGKVDSKRASVIIGMFIAGSVPHEADTVVARINEADLFSKIVDHVLDEAGAEYCIAQAGPVAAWLSDRAASLFGQLLQTVEKHKAAAKAQKEFAAQITDQLEVAGHHLQQLKTMHL